MAVKRLLFGGAAKVRSTGWLLTALLVACSWVAPPPRSAAGGGLSTFRGEVREDDGKKAASCDDDDDDDDEHHKKSKRRRKKKKRHDDNPRRHPYNSANVIGDYHVGEYYDDGIRPYASVQVGGDDGHCHCDCDDDYEEYDDDDGFTISGFIGASLTSPIWLPMSILEDRGDFELVIPAWPYYCDHRGWLVQSDDDDVSAMLLGGRVDAEYSPGFNSITRVGGHLLLDSAFRLGLDASWDHRSQPVAGGGRDQLSTGDINLVYRYAQGEAACVRAGLGANWFHDSAGTEWGINTTWGVDLFPVRPWIMTAAVDWGRLSATSLVHLRMTFGAALAMGELFIGYDWLHAGAADLHKPLVGFRLWF